MAMISSSRAFTCVGMSEQFVWTCQRERILWRSHVLWKLFQPSIFLYVRITQESQQRDRRHTTKQTQRRVTLALKPTTKMVRYGVGDKNYKDIYTKNINIFTNKSNTSDSGLPCESLVLYKRLPCATAVKFRVYSQWFIKRRSSEANTPPPSRQHLIDQSVWYFIWCSLLSSLNEMIRSSVYVSSTPHHPFFLFLISHG